MSTDFYLIKAVDAAFLAMQKSSDYADRQTVTSFMILIDTIIDSPDEVLHLKDPSRLALVLAALVSSGFLSSYPKYYEYSTGEVVCSVGFYLFMKQLDQGEMRNAHLPAFVVLLHDGRRYMTNIVEAALLSDSGAASPYNPFFQMDFDEVSKKSMAVVKGAELSINNRCKQTGVSDEYLDQWRYGLERERDSIRALIGNDFFKDAMKTYKYLENKLASASPFDFEN